MALQMKCMKQMCLVTRRSCFTGSHTLVTNFSRLAAATTPHSNSHNNNNSLAPLTPARVHATQVRHAGHAKWQNIKSTKDANDRARSILFGKIAKMISIAVREGGANPVSNTALATVFKIAAKNGVPNKTRDTAVEKALKTSANGKAYELVWRGPNGLCLVIKGFTDKVARTRISLGQILKKNGFKEDRVGGAKGMFTEVGTIVCSPEVDGKTVSLEEAEGHAIEGNAEEVVEDDGMLVFKTAGVDLHSCSAHLSAVGYSIEDLAKELVPRIPLEVDDETHENIRQLIEKLEELEDYTEGFWNVA